MANTGYFCLLVNPNQRRELAGIIDKFGEFVSSHPGLKNLCWNSVPTHMPLDGAFCAVGECDNLTPGTILEFCKGSRCPFGVRVFVVDSVYGDEWEEVHW